MPSIYEDCLKANIPTSSHYSDLYIPVTEATTKLLKEHGLKATTFHNNVEGGLWYDVSFQYDPYWTWYGANQSVDRDAPAEPYTA